MDNNLEFDHLMKIVMEQAAEKGFGTEKEDIIVSEKIALIHSEISEAYAAYLDNNLKGKDGFYEEIGDTLQRTLHLAGIFQINLSFDGSYDELQLIAKSPLEGKIARLHRIVSNVWESYRQNEMAKFQKYLICLANALYQISLDFNFSLGDIVKKKMEINRSRDWKGKRLNERFV